MAIWRRVLRRAVVISLFSSSSRSLLTLVRTCDGSGAPLGRHSALAGRLPTVSLLGTYLQLVGLIYSSSRSLLTLAKEQAFAHEGINSKVK
jgi:hypothetical protein